MGIIGRLNRLKRNGDRRRGRRVQDPQTETRQTGRGTPGQRESLACAAFGLHGWLAVGLPGTVPEREIVATPSDQLGHLHTPPIEVMKDSPEAGS